MLSSCMYLKYCCSTLYNNQSINQASLHAINRVKQKIKNIKPVLPEITSLSDNLFALRKTSILLIKVEA